MIGSRPPESPATVTLPDLLRALPAPLLIFDRGGRLVELNEAAAAVLGAERASLLGQPVDALLASVVPLPEASGELSLRTAAGAVVPARIGQLTAGAGTLVLLDPGGNRGSERQRKALHSASLATIGELATGVAHEINNPINGIINYAQQLHDRLAAGDPAGADLAGRIMREGRRISKIVHNLLGLARHDAETRVATTLAGELEAVLSLTRAQLRREGITLTVEIDPDPPPVLVNPHQIQQVLHNVLRNARYALNQKYPDGGAEKRLQITLRGWREGQGSFLRLSVVDSGLGIPPALLGRVTEAFFTTKPVGAGTGLGLSISREILHDHGGRLLIESVSGEFTRVHIDLPVSGEG